MPNVHMAWKKQSENLGKHSQIRRCQSWLGKLLRHWLRCWDSNLVSYPYTLSLLFKLFPQQQADTTDKDIMLCYTWPQTTIFIILHTYLIPYSFLEFGVPLKAVYRQLICLQASEQSFVQTQCLTHWVSHSGKHCVTQRERCPPFPHSLSTQWRTDATGWQMRCSTSLMWWESYYAFLIMLGALWVLDLRWLSMNDLSF